MYALLWRTVYAHTRMLFWCLLYHCKITLSWAHKQFATRVHTLFYISWLNSLKIIHILRWRPVQPDIRTMFVGKPNFSRLVFVKLEELHIATVRKPLIHQNQPVARYLHKKQPCMLWVMLVGLQHRTLSSKLSTDNQVICNFCIPADSTNAFGDLSVHTHFRLLYLGLFFSMLRGAK